MALLDTAYSVLLVSSSEKTSAALQELLHGPDFQPALVAGYAGAAQRRLVEQSFDLVVINSPLPDGSGIELATGCCEQGESAVLLLVPSEVYEETYYRCLPSGVMVLSKPTSMLLLRQSLRDLCSLRERLRNAGDVKRFANSERNELLSRIEKMRTDLKLWENNLGFFSNSRQSELLKAEFEKKMQQTRQQIALLEAKLKILREAEKEKENSKENDKENGDSK